jgi:hypothetical protein
VFDDADDDADDDDGGGYDGNDDGDGDNGGVMIGDDNDDGDDGDDDGDVDDDDVDVDGGVDGDIHVGVGFDESEQIKSSEDTDDGNSGDFNELDEEECKDVDTWNDTLLGVGYQEARKAKRCRKQPDLFKAATARQATTDNFTYKFLEMQGMREVLEMEKPDFIKNPHKYYQIDGSVPSFDQHPPLTPKHIGADTLKVRHDAKSIGIYDLEQKFKAVRRMQLQKISNPGMSSRSSSRTSNRSKAARKPSIWNKGLLKKLSTYKEPDLSELNEDSNNRLEAVKETSRENSRMRSGSIKQGSKNSSGKTSSMSLMKELTSADSRRR